jgi:hypothetical protein
MTIKRVGNGFMVVSKKGKNLGREKTKEEAVKRLGEVEYFKHKKCMVDPELVKNKVYTPLVFQTRDPSAPKKDLDFPKNSQESDRALQIPEFPSTPWAGHAYSQSFSQAEGSEKTHYKNPKNKQEGEYSIPSQSVIGNFASVQPADGGQEKNTTGREAMTLLYDQYNAQKNSPKKTVHNKKHGGETIKDVALAQGPGPAIKRSIIIAGRKVLLKQHLNDMSIYPNTKGEDPRPFDPEEEKEKRKAFIRSKELERKTGEIENKRKYASVSIKN